MALVPLNLFVTHDGKSRRQHVTCRYKCGDACSKPVRNTSDNEYFGDIAKAVSRRSILQASGVAVLAVGAGSVLAACGRRTARRDPDLVVGAAGRNTGGHEVRRRRAQQRRRRRHPRGLQTGRRDQLGRPDPERRAEVRCPQPDRRRAAGSVRLQQRLRGSAADRRPAEPVPVCDQPRVRHPLFMFPGYKDDAPTREQFDVEIAAIGMGVVEVERMPGGGLKPVMGATTAASPPTPR